MLNTHDIYVKLTLQEELLGTSPSDKNIYDTFIAQNSPNPELTRAEEEETIIPADSENAGKALTIFSKDPNGNPIIWDYQIKGFFKDACAMLQKVTEKGEDGKKKKAANESGKITSYKKNIDGLIFVYPRQIPIIMPIGGEIGRCQRPLRAQTPMGERVALSDAETVPAGSEIICKIACFNKNHFAAVHEWLEYGEFRGLGQWRNSGKGRFLYKEITEEEYKKFYTDREKTS